jgi:lipid-binding SYLF domain-containing protein
VRQGTRRTRESRGWTGDEILTCARSRGLSAAVSFDGVTARRARGDRRELYQEWGPCRMDVLPGRVDPPAAAEPLLGAVRKYSGGKKPPAD